MREHNSEPENNELRIEGRHSVLEAFRAGRLIERLFIQKGLSDGSILSIIKEAKKTNTVIYFRTRRRKEHTAVYLSPGRN